MLEQDLSLTEMMGPLSGHSRILLRLTDGNQRQHRAIRTSRRHCSYSMEIVVISLYRYYYYSCISLSLSHTHIYIYIYRYLYACICIELSLTHPPHIYIYIYVERDRETYLYLYLSLYPPLYTRLSIPASLLYPPLYLYHRAPASSRTTHLLRGNVHIFYEERCSYWTTTVFPPAAV